MSDFDRNRISIQDMTFKQCDDRITIDDPKEMMIMMNRKGVGILEPNKSHDLTDK